MATAPRSSSFLFLVLLLPSLVLGFSTPDSLVGPLCDCPQPNEARFQLVLHQYPAWPNDPIPNEVNSVITTQPNNFGGLLVDDWFMTDPNGNYLGRAQGFHIQAGQSTTSASWYFAHNFVFQSGGYAGSTLHVVGIYPSPSGQWSINGGTGVFTNAHGTIWFSASRGAGASGTEGIYALNI
ncbi:hypothetical protein U9M48_014041, partial [Paspalum notatum var. saurae]